MGSHDDCPTKYPAHGLLVLTRVSRVATLAGELWLVCLRYGDGSPVEALGEGGHWVPASDYREAGYTMAGQPVVVRS